MDFSNPIRAIVPTLDGEIFRVLAGTSSPLSGSRVAVLAENGSNAGVRLALSRLVQQGTVNVTSSGPSLLYTANRQHLLWPAIEHAVVAADDALHQLQSRISKLADSHFDLRRSSPTLALFGSVARGSSTPESDIDIVAVFPTSEMSELDEAFIDELTTEVPRWTGNTCNVYAVARNGINELVEREDPMIESWWSDAITFYGPELRRHLGSRPSRA